MRREEQLDQLLEQQRLGMVHLTALDADDVERMTAAKSFARLNAIEIPSDMAQRIEARVRNRVNALQAERQVAEPSRLPRHLVERRPVMRWAWIAALGTAVVLLFTFLGMTTAAANSLPGDALYGIKQWEQRVAVAWTGDQSARASLQLTQLQQAIADLRTVVSQHRSAATIEEALATVAADTQASQGAVHALPTGQPREALAHSLTKTLQEERGALHHLLSRVDWEGQLAVTRQLGALGEPVPTIAQVRMVEDTDDALVLTVNGKNFAPGAHLVINGSPRGIVLSNTPTTLRVLVQASDLPHHDAYTIGAVNPDGTAAQVRLAGGQDHPGQSEPGDHHGTPGPTHGSTPEPGDGKHPHMSGPGSDGSPEPGDMHGQHP
jgi:hypothetical protein